MTRNSSGDEIANVNFLYDDIVYVLQKKPLVHQFRHRSTRLCVGTHLLTKFSEITQYNGYYVVQGRRFWYQWKAHIRLPVINTNLPPILHRFQVMADHSSNFR